MRIKCSGGKGILEQEECLACAARGGQTCGFDLSLLRTLYELNRGHDDIHVTHLTSCLRKVYLDRQDPEVEYPHGMLRKFIGIAVHDFLAKGNGRGAEVEMQFEGVVGRPDLVVDGRLVDYKTTRKVIPDLLPYGEHEVQVNLYAYMLEQLGTRVDEMYIQYISVSGGTECSRCRVPYEPSHYGPACPRCEKQVNSANLGAALVPVRKYPPKEMADIFRYRKNALEQAFDRQELPGDEPGWLCKFCHHACDARQE